MLALAVGFTQEALLEKAKGLAKRLALPLDNEAENQLLVTETGLCLKIHPFLPLRVNLNQPHQKKGLIQACKPRPNLSILDATAGWGRDASLLASFGAKVLMLERNPIMAALLEDALEAFRDTSLQLLQIDALSYLNALPEEDYPDLIYLDPMHPVRQKSALVKKDLQILQHLIGFEEDAYALIKQALLCSRQKVVVKWPSHLPPFLKPSSCIRGKTVRFDIYEV